MPISKVSEAGLSSGAQFNGFKNRIINGAMSFWQRGTSFTGITNVPVYGCGRGTNITKCKCSIWYRVFILSGVWQNSSKHKHKLYLVQSAYRIN